MNLISILLVGVPVMLVAVVCLAMSLAGFVDPAAFVTELATPDYLRVPAGGTPTFPTKE